MLASELWTVTSWRWEWYDLQEPNPRLGGRSGWIAAEVLRDAWPWWLRPFWVLLPNPEGKATFSDGVAWATCMILGVVHLAFALAALLRPNMLLLFPSFSAFDDVVPFVWWGWAGLITSTLLLVRSISLWYGASCPAR